ERGGLSTSMYRTFVLSLRSASRVGKDVGAGSTPSLPRASSFASGSAPWVAWPTAAAPTPAARGRLSVGARTQPLASSTSRPHAVLATGELLRVRERAEGGQAHHVGDVVGGAQAAVVAVPQPGEAQRHQQAEGGAGDQELLAVRGDGGAGHDRVLVVGQLHA